MQRSGRSVGGGAHDRFGDGACRCFACFRSHHRDVHQRRAHGSDVGRGRPLDLLWRRGKRRRQRRSDRSAVPCNAVAQLSLVGDDGNNTLSVAGVITSSFTALVAGEPESISVAGAGGTDFISGSPFGERIRGGEGEDFISGGGVTTSWASPARRTATRSFRTPAWSSSRAPTSTITNRSNVS